MTVDLVRLAAAARAREAMVCAARLAGANGSAWARTKRPQGVRDIRSARIGIHYRMLFRPEPDGRLHVLAFVPREALQATIARLR